MGVQGAIAAFSGEGLRRDFTPQTCAQMMSIFEAASKSGQATAAPGKLHLVIRALSSNVETLFACLGNSEAHAQTSMEVHHGSSLS